MNIPLDARVEAADGPCGEMVTMIFNPVNWQLTHYVIQDKDKKPRLVPVLMVLPSDDSVLHLRCTRSEFSQFEPFIEINYVRNIVPIDPGYYYGYAGSMYGTYYGPYTVPMEEREIPVEEERVPVGELTARRGMPVEATDAYAGKIDRFLLDPSTETITHLVLEERHHLHKQQITVPVSAIDQVLGDTVYLKLDQRGVAALPAIPIKHHLWLRKGDKKTELVAIVFEDTEGASQALNAVKQMHHGKVFKIIEAAVLVKEQDGTTAVKETMNSATTHGRVAGAVAGGLAGLLVGPVALVVGALVGAGAGGAVAHAAEEDFSHDFIDGLQKLLQPGRSALVLLLEHEGVQKLDQALTSFDHVVSYQKLSDMLGAQLVGEKGQVTPDTPVSELAVERNG